MRSASYRIGFIRLQNGLFQAMKRAILEDETAHFRAQYRLFRNTISTVWQHGRIYQTKQAHIKPCQYMKHKKH